MKAFISHSSKQASFAVELVDLFGRDRCIIDQFDFEPALKTADEINRMIDQAVMFVLLISKEALGSPWVKLEIQKAKSNLESGSLQYFLPYIIDDSVKLEDVPDWMTREECFNIKRMLSPKMLAKDLAEKRRRLIWRENSKIRIRETAFVGRNEEIDAFQNLIYSETSGRLRAIIVSGRAGVGKDYFSQHCLEQLGFLKEYEPYRISMTAKDSVELFILNLNSICRKYSDLELKEILSKSVEEKSVAAVKLLNILNDRNEVVFIEDDMACVCPNRHLADWLSDITSNSELASRLCLFLQSKISPITYLQVTNPEIGHLQLYPLKKEDRKKLFYLYARTYGLDEINKDNADFFINKLTYSPGQLLLAVDSINRMGWIKAKQDIQQIVDLGDRSVRPIFEHFNDEDKRGLLILLSRFEFVSFDILKEIYEDLYGTIEEAIGEMMVYGIVDVFGPNQEYVRLDHYISDYIKRNRLDLPKDLEMVVEEVMTKKMSESLDITEDVSAYLYNVRQSILSGKSKKEDYLIPSVVVKAIIDLYNNSDWDGVIKVCDKVLRDNHNYYPDMEREITYWLCLALCRKKNEKRFFENVDKIKGADNLFLRGFFFRNQSHYPEAEQCYRRALRNDPKMQRAKRELVKVLLAQGNYNDALEHARDNYEADRDNTYHICAFFRCLIRSHPIGREEDELLRRLINEVRASYSEKKESLAAAMAFEYEAYISHAKPEVLLNKLKEIEKQFPGSHDVKRVAEEYRYKQGLGKRIVGAIEDE